MIISKGLTKTFEGKAAVDDIDLEIEESGIFGLIGPDGAGKTTLLRLFCGVMDPTGGDLSIKDTDVVRDPEGIKQKIGYMPQRFSLYGDLTVMENMLFYADLYLVPARERAGTIERLLKFSNLSPFIDRRAENLSGGMKQKLGLSCALIHKPEILILDEPTNGVDPLSRLEFWQILNELKEQGVFIIISTPYMEEAENCDHIALMNSGKLLYHGPPEDFKKRHKGKVLEISTGDNQKAADMLGSDPNILALNHYGDVLHLNLSTKPDKGYIKKTLDSAGIELAGTEEVYPGIEDVFIYLIKAGTDE